jgi:surface-anchored protein
MNRWFRLVAPVALAGLLVGAAAAPAQAQNPLLEFGHVDVFDIDYLAGTDSLDVNVFADSDTDHPGTWHPDNVDIEVTRQFTVPATWNICATGTARVLRQSVPQAQLDEEVWAGYNTHDVDAGDVPGNQVTVSLVSVSGPSGSSGFCIYTASGGVPTLLIDDDGSPTSFTIPADTHAHVNWAFASPGTYNVTVNITASGTSASGNHTFTFVVI